MSASESGTQAEQINLQVLAARLAEVEKHVGLNASTLPTLGFTDDKLGVMAGSIYRARQRRLKHFDAELFGDPAWDMLLDLFVKQVRGERVSVTSLCLAAHVTQTTGLRWIDILIANGLARKFDAPDDRRLSLVELTRDGYRRVRAYVSEGIGKFDMPAPGPVASG